MAFKFVLFVAWAVIASVNAGITLTSGSENIYRSPGNLAQISTQTKNIETPYSSSSKTDVRVSNPSVYVSAQPALSYSSHATPIYASAAPAIYENQPAYSYAAAPVAHTQAYYPQQHQQAAPSVYPVNQQLYAAAPSHVHAKTAYTGPTEFVVNYRRPSYDESKTNQHAPSSYNIPSMDYASAAAPQPYINHAWSPANEVSHLTYSNVNDHTNYSW